MVDIKIEHALFGIFMMLILLFILASPNEVISKVTNALTGQAVNDLSLQSKESSFLAKSQVVVSKNYILILEVLSGIILILIVFVISRSVIISKRNSIDKGSLKPLPGDSESLKSWSRKNDYPLLKELKSVNQELSSLADIEEEKAWKIEQPDIKEWKPKDKKKEVKKVILAVNSKYDNEIDYINRELASLGAVEEKPRPRKEIPPVIQKKVSIPEVKVKVEKPIIKVPERKLESKVKEEPVKRKIEVEEKVDQEIFKQDISAKKYSSAKEAFNDADKLSKDIKDLVRNNFA